MTDKVLSEIRGHAGQWVLIAIIPEPDGEERRILIKPGTNRVIVTSPDESGTLNVTAGPYTTEEIEDAARDAVFGRGSPAFVDNTKIALGYFLSQASLNQQFKTQS